MKSKNRIFDNFKKIILNSRIQEYISLLTKEDLESFLKERWSFINLKYKKTIKIRCYNSKQIWPLHTSIIEINSKDKPFLVDTVADYLKSIGIQIFLLDNLLFNLQRDKNHNIISLNSYIPGSSNNESYIYIEIEKLEDRKLLEIQKQIFFNLKELEMIVNDFKKIKEKILKINFKNLDLKKDKEWILENFIIMGYSSFENNHLKKTLGILKNQSYSNICIIELQKIINSKPKKNEFIDYLESSIKSNVKRFKPLLLLLFFHNNKVDFIIGSFSGRGELTPRFLIPNIRRKLDEICKDLNAPINGFRYKEIFKISQLIPIGILFTRSKKLIQECLAFFINNLYVNEQKILITKDREHQGIWVLIIELQKFSGKVNFKENLEKNNIHIHTFFRRTYNQFEYSFFFLKSEKYSLKKFYNFLRKNTQKLFFSWYDMFLQILSNKISNNKNLKQKFDFYIKLIPNAFTDYVSPKECLKNLLILETISKNKKFYVRFGSSISPIDKNECISLNVYSCYRFNLTDIFPALDSIGLKITTEISFDFSFPDTIKYLNIFYIQNPLEKNNLNFLKKIEEGIEDILNEKYTIEKTNQLLLTTFLNIREINLIKTIAVYYYQSCKQYSRIYIQEFFIKHSKFSELLIEYIKKVFLEGQVQSQRNILLKKIEEYIYKLNTISEQTISLHIKEILENMVRTNFFLNYDEIAIKIRTKKISFIPNPKPLYEVYVYSKDLEGIHIRSDLIARGGIRWSDRIDDFRTEIYELMKTQLVKNTIIIPNGAKGGFIIKKDLGNTKQKISEISQEFYKKFISSLLSITDNIDSHHQILHPKNIITLDENDPYLVVAADKGTATFSDLANSISIEKQFWLQDAFASGGSNGYDHKKQGITAKGVWESVKRHFLELGIDPEKNEITVIGIGDMSGDVFGNGMLLSKTIKLIAAFNHLHIFIDPDPDPEISYQERLRLFKEVKGWNEYNKLLLSKGGGIFERNSAKIELSKEIQERLEIPKNIINGEELIRYILKAKADLLWNGGIGTYIKASNESNKDIHDTSNDNVRVNANELNVKIIAEGGNLGMTYYARIEAAKRGIKVNTDFIDNSGGVDMSDHEVNLKIFLNSLKEKNFISLKKRNQIIKKLETLMIHKVLENNEFNNLAIALDFYRLKSYDYLIPDWIEFLKNESIIPPNELKYHQELTNPEICYLICYTKLYFKNLLYSYQENFTEEIENYFLLEYFSVNILKKFKEELKNFPLKRELVKVKLLNLVINSQGSLYLNLMHQITNKSYFEILKEYAKLVILMQINVYQIYKKFYNIPKKILYENLLKISNTFSLVHILINKENQFLLEKDKISKFNEIFKKMISIEKKIQNVNSDPSTKLEILIKSLEKTFLYYFLDMKYDIKKFLIFFKESNLEKVLYLILSTKINNLQELRFQYRILNLYLMVLKKIIIRDPRKVQEKIKQYIRNEENIKSIDIFELIIDLESSIKIL